MLRWLSREDSYEDALDRLMKVIPLDQRERTRSKVVTGVAMYDLACCASNADVHQVIEDIRTVSFKVILLLTQISIYINHKHSFLFDSITAELLNRS